MRLSNILIITFILVIISACDSNLTNNTQSKKANFHKSMWSSSVKPMSNSRWDWTADTLQIYYGQPVPGPWTKEMHDGVHLDEVYHCPYSEGWRLYIKRLRVEDYASNSKKVQSKNAGLPLAHPYFILYNKYLGILRVFVYMGGHNEIGEDHFIFNTGIINGTTDAYEDIGFFLNSTESYALPLDKKTKEINMKREQVFSAQYKKWEVFDYFLSYDPDASNYSNTYFDIEIQAENTSYLSLKGSFDFKIKNYTNNQGFTIGKLFNDAVKSPRKFNKASKGIKSFQQGLKKDGNSLGGAIGDVLVSFADAIKPATNIIGPVAGAIDFVSSFTNLLSGSTHPTTISYSEGVGSLNLNGKIKNNYSMPPIEFGILADSTSPADSANLDLPSYNKPIGLFSLVHKPIITVTSKEFFDTYTGPNGNYYQGQHKALYLDLSNFSIAINPTSDMQLVEAEYYPIIEVEGSYLQPRGGVPPWYRVKKGNKGSIYINNNFTRRYSYVTNGSATPMSPRSALSGKETTNDIIIGPTKSLDLHLLKKPSYPGKQFNFEPRVTGAFVKYYFVFENTNDPSIQARFMRTYKAKLVKQ